MIPGEIIVKNQFIEINPDADSISIPVTNNGDRPVQIGSHFHFFEINRCMSFDRSAAFGMRLNIPSGTAVRFEAGETKNVELIPIDGKKIIKGLNNLTDAQINPTSKAKAMLNAELKGFK